MVEFCKGFLASVGELVGQDPAVEPQWLALDIEMKQLWGTNGVVVGFALFFVSRLLLFEVSYQCGLLIWLKRACFDLLFEMLGLFKHTHDSSITIMEVVA